MKKKSNNGIKLGVFVLTGLTVLIFGLYILGKNTTFLGNRLELKTQFRDVNGLLVGNNVRFSGIDVGRVLSIKIVNDTVIEVTMNLNNNLKSIIRNNSITSVGTDGLIGNRVLNIAPGTSNAPFVNGGEYLPSKENIDTDKMLSTLNKTNKNVAKIAEDVLVTVQMISTSSELASLLNDKTLSANLRASLQQLHEAAKNASVLMKDAVSTLRLASEGDGAIASLLNDTSVYVDLRQAIGKVNTLGESANRLVKDINRIAASLENDLQQGKGPATALLRDSVMTERLRATIEHAEKGSAAFAEDMIALKSSLLFRRHFKKLEKEAAKKEAAEKGKKE